MKKFFFILLFGVPGLISAQAFRIEFGMSIFVNKQTGTLYAPDPTHVPNWHDKTNIDRSLTRAGLAFNVYYPLNFGTTLYETFSFGPQAGFCLNNSSKPYSLDYSYNDLPTSPTLRVPMLMALRWGSMNMVYQRPIGLALASGVEIIKLNAADETGTFLLPVIQSSFAIGRLIFSVNAYPMSIKSLYLIEGVEEVRLETKVLEFQVTLGFDAHARKYKNDRQKPGRSYSKR